MRPLRLVALAAAVVSLTGLGPASAKTCNLVSDTADDAYMGLGAPAPSINALDIRSMDIATGRNTLVVVLRMKATDGKAEQISGAGMYWKVDFQVSGVPLSFQRTLTNAATGAAYEFSAKQANVAIPGVKFAATSTTLTWTVPRNAIAKMKKPGAQFGSFFVSAASSIGLAHDYAPNDSRPSGAKYADKTPSCVKAS